MHWTGLHPAIILLGVAVAIAAGIYVRVRYADALLAFFVFVMVAYTLGWGLAEVITRPHRVPRALYFLLLPLTSVAVLVGAYASWEEMWLAVLLGFFAGGTIHTILGRLLLPRITFEETGPAVWNRDAQRQDIAASEDVMLKWLRGLSTHPLRSLALGIVTDRYYRAIKRRDYATAYGYLAPEARAAVSQEEFAQRARAQESGYGPVEEFSNPPVVVKDPATVAVFVTRQEASYTVNLQLRHDRSGWHIIALEAI